MQRRSRVMGKDSETEAEVETGTPGDRRDVQKGVRLRLEAREAERRGWGQ